jgi:hypothetical protein
MVDKSDIATLSFFMGGLFSICLMSFLSIPNWGSKYKELLRYTKSLIELQDGIVTVADLALKAEVSPAKAAKFLKKLAIQRRCCMNGKKVKADCQSEEKFNYEATM